MCLSIVDFLVANSSPREKYYSRPAAEKTSVHWGQRKLFLTELQFLTMFDDSLVENPIIVYAGAAPGIHIQYLSELFPRYIFHLYDPRQFADNLRNVDNIFTYQRPFTDEDAVYWSTQTNVYFISDIRTAEWKRMTREQTEASVSEDMQMQMHWYETINPIQAHLKFRLPWPDRWPSITYRYLFGYLFKQPWAPQSSTEGRLVPVKGRYFDWNIQDYEEVMFYFNNTIRETFKCNEAIDPPELTDDFDSNAEVFILKEYIAKYEYPLNVVDFSRELTRQLNIGGQSRSIRS